MSAVHTCLQDIATRCLTCYLYPAKREQSKTIYSISIMMLLDITHIRSCIRTRLGAICDIIEEYVINPDALFIHIKM